MYEILSKIHRDYNFYKDKVNQCAGYFIKENFDKVEYEFDKTIIDKIHDFEIDINDFSNYVVELCNGNYSKLLFILIFAYNVEV